MQISHSASLLLIGCAPVPPASESSTFKVIYTENGNQLWEDQVSVTGTPSVTPNDRIAIVPTTSGLIAYALLYTHQTRTPAYLWQRSDLLGTSAPSLFLSGLFALFSTSQAEVVCVDTLSGDTNWTHSSTARTYYASSLPASISSDVAILTSDRFVESVTADGKIRWVTVVSESGTSNYIEGPVTVDRQGQIWVTRFGEMPLLVLDQNGDEIGESKAVTCSGCPIKNHAVTTLVISQDETAAIIYNYGNLDLHAIRDSSCHKRYTPDWGVAILVCVGVLAGMVTIAITVLFVGRTRSRHSIQIEGEQVNLENSASYNSFVDTLR